ncbi:MAG: hypothetical protein FWD09_09580, partial [Lentimicrobiaceae bacterium]|nr:hypothetical protein [Lentimicrobiaceae bacterium]
LPQAGDFALGVDATPFLRYMGNFFTSGNNVAPFFNGVNGVHQTLYGKYFLQDDRAIRARLSVGVFNDTEKGVVPNDPALADNPLATLIDIQRMSEAAIELGAGYEFRRGHGRVQGFWGGEVSLGFSSAKTSYDFANRMTEDYPNPSTYDFGYPYNTFNPIVRTTEVKRGNEITIGLGGFAGVEYFFAPQMSLGGEVGLGFYFRTAGQGQATTESWDTGENKLRIDVGKDLGWNAQNIAVGSRAAGRIFLMFHF